VPQLSTESPTDITDRNHRRHISVGISQRVGKKLRACATITDGITDGITVEFYRRNIPSVTCGGNFFFGALIRPYFRRKFCWYFYFFITDRHGDGIRITDVHDSDGFVSSEISSVIILPMVFVPFTDRMNSSVKLYNGVVRNSSNKLSKKNSEISQDESIKKINHSVHFRINIWSVRRKKGIYAWTYYRNFKIKTSLNKLGFGLFS